MNIFISLYQSGEFSSIADCIEQTFEELFQLRFIHNVPDDEEKKEIADEDLSKKEKKNGNWTSSA